jgi:hypothetical protein
MKHTALRLSIAASILMAAVNVASAQNMKAEIPFAFHVAGATMQPGSYLVALQHTGSGAQLVQFHSLDDRRSVIAMPVSHQELRLGQIAAVLSFACTGGRCDLAGIRSDDTKYTFRTAKPSPETRIATVVLRPGRTE